jgi:hypothetical protein
MSQDSALEGRETAQSLCGDCSCSLDAKVMLWQPRARTTWIGHHHVDVIEGRLRGVARQEVAHANVHLDATSGARNEVPQTTTGLQRLLFEASEPCSLSLRFRWKCGRCVRLFTFIGWHAAKTDELSKTLHQRNRSSSVSFASDHATVTP